MLQLAYYGLLFFLQGDVTVTRSYPDRSGVADPDKETNLEEGLLSSLLSEYETSPTNCKSKAAEEIEHYLKESSCPMDGNPFEW